jgi:hypothetical protein
VQTPFATSRTHFNNRTCTLWQSSIIHQSLQQVTTEQTSIKQGDRAIIQKMYRATHAARTCRGHTSSRLAESKRLKFKWQPLYIINSSYKWILQLGRSNEEKRYFFKKWKSWIRKSQGIGRNDFPAAAEITSIAR